MVSAAQTLWKLLVLFFFDNQTLSRDQFHLSPPFEGISPKKLLTHFPYPRYLSPQRTQRLFNHSSLLHHHPFSIQIQLDQSLFNAHPSLIAVWNYPIFFDHLPVFRLAKVLHFSLTNNDSTPCSSEPCHPNEHSFSIPLSLQDEFHWRELFEGR